MKKALFFILAMFTCISIFAQQQPVVAVAPFDAISGISTSDANMITRVFNIRLGNTNRVTLVDRSIIDRVLREHHFQLTDWSDMNKTAELGRALNADWIVRGEIERFGSNILVTVQFFDIRTFRYMGGADILLANTEEAMDKMDPLVNNLINTLSMSARKYNIGDTGPGGGIVFHIEGNTYFEVGPSLGNMNWNAAVQAARNYRGGNLSDWYLPSIQELEFMFSNLQRAGIDFGSGIYWSSTELHIDGAMAKPWSRDINIFDILKNNLYTVRPVRSFRP